MPLPKPHLSAAARISLIYLIVGALWILLSDSLLSAIFSGNEGGFALAQTFKGWMFVMVTASVLYALLRVEFAARERYEQKLREHEGSIRRLFTSSPIPMYVYNRQTLAFIDVNDAACTRYGYTRDEFAKLSLFELRPPEDAPLLLQYLHESPEKLVPREARHLTKSGEILTVQVYFQMLDFDHQPAMLIAVQDLTERNRIEVERLENERLRLQLAKESELHAMRSGFISMVSHEFRRPLTTIIASIELLEQYRSRMTEDSAQKHFTRIHFELDEMKELLDDFLTLMQTEARNQDFQPTPVDVTDLCQQLIEQMRISDKGVHSIVCDCPNAPVVIKGDEKLLRRAIGNLLANAVKYSPSGSEVRLQLRSFHAIEIHVCDHGIGIPGKDQERIFEPFYRASNVGETGGTGLGLSITKQAVELHNGSIQIARSNSSGTEFIVTLPAAESAILTGC